MSYYKSGRASIQITGKTTAGDIIWEFPGKPGEIATIAEGNTVTISVRPGLGVVTPTTQVMTVIARSSDIERSRDNTWVTARFWHRAGDRYTRNDSVTRSEEGSESKTYLMRYEPRQDQFKGEYTFTAQGEAKGSVTASVIPLKFTVSASSAATVIAAVKVKVGDQEGSGQAFAAGVLYNKTGIEGTVSGELKKLGFSLSLSKTVATAQADSDSGDASASHRLHKSGAHSPGAPIEASAPMKVTLAVRENYATADWDGSFTLSADVEYTVVDQDLRPAY
jgi:hypothetical protein